MSTTEPPDDHGNPSPARACAFWHPTGCCDADPENLSDDDRARIEYAAATIRATSEAVMLGMPSSRPAAGTDPAKAARALPFQDHRFHVCSVFARMPRYSPSAPGILRH